MLQSYFTSSGLKPSLKVLSSFTSLFLFLSILCNSAEEPTKSACLILAVVLLGTSFYVLSLPCKSCNLSTVSATCLIKLPATS